MNATVQSMAVTNKSDFVQESKNNVFCADDDCLNTMRFSKTSCNMNVRFPWKVHAMLTVAEEDDLERIVSWLPNGRSFKVHNQERIVKEILPRFFKQTKYKSFQRQLNLWGFKRITAGYCKGAYSHEWLIRGEPQYCKQIKRLVRLQTTNEQESQIEEMVRRNVKTPVGECGKLKIKNILKPNDAHAGRQEGGQPLSEPFPVPCPIDTNFAGQTCGESSMSVFEGRQFYSIEDHIGWDCLLTCTF